MADMSLLVEMFKKSQGANRQPGKPGMRTSSRAPALPGFARGTMGSLGSKMLQDRDSSAGLNKERETLNSPIFKAFIAKMLPLTPIGDALRNTPQSLQVAPGATISPLRY